jgi:hypothetical protein
MKAIQRTWTCLFAGAVVFLPLMMTGCDADVDVPPPDVQYNPDDGWKIQGRFRIRFDDPDEIPSCSILSASVVLPSYFEVTDQVDVTLTAKDVFDNTVASVQFQSAILPASSPRPIAFPPPGTIEGFLNGLRSNPLLANGGTLEIDSSIPTSINTSTACSAPFEFGVVVVCDGVEFTANGEASLAGLFQNGFMFIVDALGSTPEGQKNALDHKLSALTHMAESGNTQGAREKLMNDILPKVDGPQAWIVNAEAQENLRAFAEEYLAVLENGC